MSATTRRMTTGLTTRLMWALVALSAPGGASAEMLALRAGTDARMRTVEYQRDAVLSLKGVVGYQIHLQFSPDERFVNLAAGDTTGLDVGAEGPHLMLKPKQPKLRTNLTIVTTQRVYTVEYSAAAQLPRDPRQANDVIWSVRFTYPEDERRARDAEARERAVEAALVAARPRNVDYRFCGGPAALRPDRVWDDGLQTHWQFGRGLELPAVFVRNADRTESLVNFRVQDDVLIADRVARDWVLRRGKLTSCVRNGGYREAPSAVSAVAALSEIARPQTGVSDTATGTRSADVLRDRVP